MSTVGKGAAVQRRRIGAYGLCRNDEGRVLLVRTSSRSNRLPPGTWMLPGGRVEHGEDPADTVVRELSEETGLAADVRGLREVAAEVTERAGQLDHTDSLVYDLTVTGGRLRPEVDGSSEFPRWVTLAEAAGLPLSWMAARVLGYPAPAAPTVPVPAAVSPGPKVSPPPGLPPLGVPRPPGAVQRFAAYGLVTDPDGRVLLTENAQGYPRAGYWHLPGGGTDFGEQPADGLLREIVEESAQVGQVGELLAASHHRDPSARGPGGYPVDRQAVWVVFRVHVPLPTAAWVVEQDGSTAAARWLAPAEAWQLPLTELAAAALGRLT